MAETREQRIQRLADLVVHNYRLSGTCTDEDLLEAGFTTVDLVDIGPPAYRMASEQLGRIVAEELQNSIVHQFAPSTETRQ